MKITIGQLRKVIKEEVSRIYEAEEKMAQVQQLASDVEDAKSDVENWLDQLTPEEAEQHLKTIQNLGGKEKLQKAVDSLEQVGSSLKNEALESTDRAEMRVTGTLASIPMLIKALETGNLDVKWLLAAAGVMGAATLADYLFNRATHSRNNEKRKAAGEKEVKFKDRPTFYTSTGFGSKY